MNWNLNVLYLGFDDPRLAEDGARALSLADEAEALLRKDMPLADKLRAVLTKMEEGMSRLMNYDEFISLTLAADADNEPALALRENLMRLSMRYRSLSSALSRFLGACEGFEEAIASDPYLTEHAFLLRETRELAAHTIDPAVEGVALEMQLSGAEAFSNLQQELAAGHMVSVERNGKIEKLPLATVRGMANDPDAAVRKKAYEAELAAYPDIETPMAACLNGIKGGALTMCRLKKYDSLLDMTLAQSRLDRETLDALLDAMRESLPEWRRYFRIKARALGHAGALPYYDLFAPVGSSARTYTLEEARAVLLDTVGSFSPDMYALFERAFDEKWIDAYPRKGKTGGAFCAGNHAHKQSFVLTNFDSSLGALSTIAHELGHAFHNHCMETNSALEYDPPMPLGETASIFNETLFTQKMLRKADKAERALLLDQQLTDAAQVIVDILSRYIFETEMIERRKDHTLGVKELCALMLDAQKQTYGDGLDPAYMHPYMWACKSHYYIPDLHFYNFPYAFGLLFGRGVYALYEKEGDAFLPRYRALLRDTTRMNARDVAATAGIDLRDPAFWRASLATLTRDIDEFDKLV